MPRAPDVEVVATEDAVFVHHGWQVVAAFFRLSETKASKREAFRHASDFANKLAEELATKETQR